MKKIIYLILCVFLLVSCNISVSIKPTNTETTSVKIIAKDRLTGTVLSTPSSLTQRSLSQDGYGRTESFELMASCPEYESAMGDTNGTYKEVFSEDGVIDAGMYQTGLWNFTLRAKDLDGNVIYQGTTTAVIVEPGEDVKCTVKMDVFKEGMGSLFLDVSWTNLEYIPNFTVSYHKIGTESTTITERAFSESNFNYNIPNLEPGYYQVDVSVFGSYGEIIGESLSVLVLNGNTTNVTGSLGKLVTLLGAVNVELSESKIQGEFTVAPSGSEVKYVWSNTGTDIPAKYIWTINGHKVQEGLEDYYVVSLDKYKGSIVSCIAIGDDGTLGSTSIQVTCTYDVMSPDIDVSLTEENDAIPKLINVKASAPDAVVNVRETESEEFSSSHSIIGKVIEISGSEFEEAELDFFLSDEVEFDHESYLICKYDESGKVTYYAPTSSEEDRKVSALVEGEGTYYLLDVKALIEEFGRLNEENDADPDTVMAPADIVFLIDSSGSMASYITAVKNGVSDFVTYLSDNSVSAALALIDFRDIEEDGADSTVVHKNGTKNWFYDVDDFKTSLSSISADGGGDTPESSIDALETGRLLDLRDSASKFFILLTDATYKIANNYGITSMEQEIALLKNTGINCSVIGPSYNSSFDSLVSETGGISSTIGGGSTGIYNALLKIAEKIGTVTVKDGYWVYLSGPIPTPVKLDAKPDAFSTTDTDADGLLDIQELGSETPTAIVDLDELITLSSHGNITGTTYGKILSYKYLTNPVIKDE